MGRKPNRVTLFKPIFYRIKKIITHEVDVGTLLGGSAGHQVEDIENEDISSAGRQAEDILENETTTQHSFKQQSFVHQNSQDHVRSMTSFDQVENKDDSNKSINSSSSQSCQPASISDGSDSLQDHGVAKTTEEDHLCSANEIMTISVSPENNSSDHDDYEISGGSMSYMLLQQKNDWLQGSLIRPSSENASFQENLIAANASGEHKESPDVISIKSSGKVLPVVYDIDDENRSPIQLYTLNQVISLRKASFIFKDKTEYIRTQVPKELLCQGVYKKNTVSFEAFASTFWQSKLMNDPSPFNNGRSLELAQAIFDPNVNVTELLGVDFEDRCLMPSKSEGTFSIYPEDLGKGANNRSLRGLVEAKDMRGLQTGHWASTQVQDAMGHVCVSLRKVLCGKSDTCALPSELFSLGNRTCEILPSITVPVLRHLNFNEEATIGDAKEKMKVLAYDLGVVPMALPGRKFEIPEDTRYLVCAFMRPNWIVGGEKHAAFIKVDLEEKSMIAFDSLKWSMEECVTSMQYYIHQYSLRNRLLRYSPEGATDTIPSWTIYDISKESLTQHNGIDCTLWSVWMMWSHCLDISPTVFLTPVFEIKNCQGAAFGWSGCGLINNDVRSMKNTDSWGTQHTFMDRFRLIVAYFLSHLEGGDDRLGVPSVDKIMEDFRKATINYTQDSTSVCLMNRPFFNIN
jgi:hypothetical protein